MRHAEQRRRARRSVRWSALAACAVGAGCSTVGPSVIHQGRQAYNDAITRTNNEQILAMIVRMRYSEPSGLLAVSSVTANVRVQVRADAQFGVGPESNYVGNLVPLGVGAVYEENPTISYTPVQGEAYLRALMAPIPIDLTALLLSASGHSPILTTLLVRSVNGIQNPDALYDPAAAPDPRFARVAELLQSLDRRGSITWLEEPGHTADFWVNLHGEGEEHSHDVAALFETLGLGEPPDDLAAVRLPVRFGGGAVDGAAILMRTRSVYDLFRLAAASVEAPEEQVRSGLAPALPTSGPAGSLIRIRRSSGRPADAMVAVQCHGWWWSIDGADVQSKEVFRILETLMSVRIADSAAGAAGAPVLTVPVSR